MYGLGSSFQYEEIKSMVAESMEEYGLASAEAAYERPGEQVPIGFMASRRGFYDRNISHLWDQKHPSFSIQTCSENTNSETAAVDMSVA